MNKKGETITWFQCGKKVKHKTEKAAYAQYRQIKKSGRLMKNTLNVYKCGICGFFHLGHREDLNG